MNTTASLITELPFALQILMIAIGLFVGLLIGSVGVGGILLVPALIYLAKIDIHTAIASCMFSYAFSGLAGAWLYAREGSIQWSSGWWLCAGAMPGAWLGATLVNQIASERVVLIIAVFIVFAAINSIRSERQSQEPDQAQRSTAELHRPVLLVMLGVVTGIGSALSGSGGPLVLVPVLVWLGWPVLTAVGLGQLIQIPVSLLADVANVNAGRIDVLLGLCIAATVTTGVLAGVQIAHRVPAVMLRRMVIVALLVSAIWMMVQVL